MTDPDIFELLRDGDPAAAHTLPGADSPLGRSIRATVMANVHVMPTSRRRRVVIIIAVVLAALLTAAAAFILSDRKITTIGGVGCYDAPSLDANVIVAPHDGLASTDACTGLWRDGLLPIDQTLPNNPEQPVIGCVTDAGTLVVFPSSDQDLCADLGLAKPAPQTGPDPLVHLEAQLLEAIDERTCLTIPQARKAATELLNASGIEGWTVKTQPEHPDRLCTTVSVNTTNNTIYIVPVPRLELEP